MLLGMGKVNDRVEWDLRIWRTMVLTRFGELGRANVFRQFHIQFEWMGIQQRVFFPNEVWDRVTRCLLPCSSFGLKVLVLVLSSGKQSLNKVLLKRSW